jgi:ABC-type multidrug transport system fused ATPase/permease subunit
MRRYILENKLWLFTTVMVRVVGAAMQVFVALLAKEIVDTAIRKDINGFIKIILFTVFYFLIQGFVNYLTNTTQALYLKKTLIQLKEDIFNAVIYRDYKAFFIHNTADYISNLTNDINLIENNYIVPYLMLIGDVVIFILTTAVLLFINVWITLIMFLTSFILMIAPFLFGKIIDKKQKIVSDSLGKFTNKTKDIFQGYEVIKTYSIEKEISDEFSAYNVELEEHRFKSFHIKAIAQSVSTILGVGSQLAGIALAGYFVLMGTMSAGTLLAVVQLSNGIQGPIMWILEKVTLIKGMKSVNKKIINIVSEGNTSKNNKKLKAFKNSIVVDNLSFSYIEGKQIISNLSVIFEKNKKYAIIGESGSGKTTLIKLILGYYDNYQGDIFIDGISVKEIDKRDLNKTISIIHQNVFLFNKSVKDNILLYKSFDKEKIESTLQKSGINQFLSLLPDGLNSMVGENGQNLSGGQKQRIAIARALIQDTPILILDEGTSALDLQTAYEIEKTLLDINDLTVITITHKLSYGILKKYDEIIVMDKGRIVERGSLDQLIKNKGIFFKLYMIDEQEKLTS